MLMFSCPVEDIFEAPVVGINIRSEAFISEEQLSFNTEQMFGADWNSTSTQREGEKKGERERASYYTMLLQYLETPELTSNIKIPRKGDMI